MTPSDVPGGLLASWLLTYAIHSTLLLGAAWAVARIARPSLAVREVLWKTALVGALVTASWQVAIPGASPAGSRWVLPHRDVAVAQTASSYRLVPGGFVIDTGAGAIPSTSAATSAEPHAAPAGLRAWWRTVSPFLPIALVGVWILGAALSLFRLGLAKVRLHRLLRDRRPVAGGSLPDLLDRLRRSAGIRGAVRLTVSERVPGPVALGRAEVCLPARVITDLDPVHQESVLAHELGHLTRRDPAWLVAVATIEAVFFFQPLNRLARRTLRETAEFLCDDWAVTHTGRSLTLARCLAEVAGWLQNPSRPAMASAMAEGGSPLVRRIERLLEDRPRRVDRLRSWAWIGVGSMVVLTAATAPGVTSHRRASVIVTPEAPSIAAMRADLAPAAETAPDATLTPFAIVPDPPAVEYAPVPESAPRAEALPPLRERIHLEAPAPSAEVVVLTPDPTVVLPVGPSDPDDPAGPWVFRFGDQVRIDLQPLAAALAASPEIQARLKAVEDQLRTQLGPNAAEFDRFLREELGPQLERLNRELDPETRARILDLRNRLAREQAERRLEQREALEENARMAREAAREAARAMREAAIRAQASRSRI
jgi:beta-lactamase regulating signal transducer with metallopeptidase domain